MPITPRDLALLSRLLDEALDLAPGARRAWLDGLPAAQAGLRPELERLLQAHDAEADQGTDAGPLGGRSRQALAGVIEETPRTGARVGPYRLLRELGAGGMGTVWLAERSDGTLKRHVALKLPRLAWGAGLAERMARERDIGALLTHPHIARLYDAGVDAFGRPYLALEHIDGEPLDDWCRHHAPPLADRLRLFLQVVHAVAHAHARLVVHRDIKPSNVLVDADGHAHLLDFGIAKRLGETSPDDGLLTREQGQVLTPRFASPEQLCGEPVTVASDVYALGVLLFGLLTDGAHPHDGVGHDRAALTQAVLHRDPARPSRCVADAALARRLRGDLDAIAAQALQREPARRYATAHALAQDIERHLAGQPVAARPDQLAYRLGKALHRHRLAFTAAAIAVATVAGASGMAAVQAQRARQAADRERAVKEFVAELLRSVPPQAPFASQRLEARARVQARFGDQPALRQDLLEVVEGLFALPRARALESPQAADIAAARREGYLFLVHLRSETDGRPVDARRGQAADEVIHVPLRGGRLDEQASRTVGTFLATGDTLVWSDHGPQAHVLLFLHRVLQNGADPARAHAELLRGRVLDADARRFVADRLREAQIAFALPP